MGLTEQSDHKGQPGLMEQTELMGQRDHKDHKDL